MIFLDTGTGLHKVEKYVDIIDRYEDVYIILSHYHLDHIIGLTYISKWFRDKKVIIWGPGKKYYERTCHVYKYSYGFTYDLRRSGEKIQRKFSELYNDFLYNIK